MTKIIEVLAMPEDIEERFTKLMVIANSFFDQYGIVILITDNEYNGVRSNMTLDDTVAMMLSAINATATPVTEH
jgi:hypothetical protein